MRLFVMGLLCLGLAGCVSKRAAPKVLWVGNMAKARLPVTGGGAERSVVLGVRDDGVVVWKAGRRIAE